jgi:hypothetical protein
MAGVMSKPKRSPRAGQKRPRLSLAGYQRPVPAGRHPPRNLWLDAWFEAVERPVSVFNPPPIPVPPLEELRATAIRLTAELDQAKLHRAAAHVSMAVQALAGAPDPAVNDNVHRSDVECEFELDEHDRVWMIRDGDCHIIGRKDYVKTEMWRFLRTMLAKTV